MGTLMDELNGKRRKVIQRLSNDAARIGALEPDATMRDTLALHSINALLNVGPDQTTLESVEKRSESLPLQIRTAGPVALSRPSADELKTANRMLASMKARLAGLENDVLRYTRENNGGMVYYSQRTAEQLRVSITLAEQDLERKAAGRDARSWS